MDKNQKMIVALGADHGGYLLKEAAKQLLDEKNIAYVDFGCHSIESVNYPEYAMQVCHAIQSGECTCGLLFCGTGIGMSMAANKQKGIRAACCADSYSVKMTRRHNNANVLCLGGRVIGAGLALVLIEEFLSTDFEGGRHQLRIDMFSASED